MNEPKWEYLKLEVFDVRQAAALMFLRDCPLIVEFGGWETPVSRLAPTRVPVIQSDRLGSVDGPFGFVALGLDPRQDTEWNGVQNLFNRSRRAVIEYADGHGPGSMAAALLESRSKKKTIWHVTFDLSENKLPEMPGYKPHMKRRMVVLE